MTDFVFNFHVSFTHHPRNAMYLPFFKCLWVPSLNELDFAFIIFLMKCLCNRSVIHILTTAMDSSFNGFRETFIARNFS